MSKVSLKAYNDAANTALFRLGALAVISVLAVVLTLNMGTTKATSLALDGADKATKVALEAANEKGVAHNGLLDRMRELSATFITRGNLYSALIAAGVVSGIYFGFARGGN